MTLYKKTIVIWAPSREVLGDAWPAAITAADAHGAKAFGITSVVEVVNPTVDPDYDPAVEEILLG